MQQETTKRRSKNGRAKNQKGWGVKRIEKVDEKKAIEEEDFKMNKAKPQKTIKGGKKDTIKGDKKSNEVKMTKRATKKWNKKTEVKRRQKEQLKNSH